MSFRASAPSAQLSRRPSMTRSCRFLGKPPVWGSPYRRAPGKSSLAVWSSGEKTRRGGGDPAQQLSCFVRAHRAHHPRPRPRWSWIREIDPDDISLYVGIPFCPSRCYYCSFVSSTTAQSGALIEPYLETLCGEIRETAALVRQAGKRVQSIYIGGSTPTTLSAEQLERLTAALADSFDLSALREYTVEAGRPDTITPEKLRVLKTPASAASASIRSPWRTACSRRSAESTRRPMCCALSTRRGRPASARSTWTSSQA